MGESNFKTWGDAQKYCEKYDASQLVRMCDKFELAEALLRAFKDGVDKKSIECDAHACTVEALRRVLDSEEVSDFALSFPLIRRVAELVAQAQVGDSHEKI